jgi:hypothetical protein
MSRVPLTVLFPSRAGQWVLAWLTPVIPAGVLATFVVVAAAMWLPEIGLLGISRETLLRGAAIFVFFGVYGYLHYQLQRHIREYEAGTRENGRDRHAP